MLLIDPVFSYLKRNGQSQTKQIFKEKIMNLVRSYNNWRRYRETISELGRLTSRELSDLGINRSDIPFVARRASSK
jgi:uncharacterized protein YjiS (DUF1127 family)